MEDMTSYGVEVFYYRYKRELRQRAEVSGRIQTEDTQQTEPGHVRIKGKEKDRSLEDRD